jgi:pentatricopeptide repeat protein
MYAKAGRWDDIDKMQKKMKDNKVGKNPACS